jgi:AcrR family transcriptional regulator
MSPSRQTRDPATPLREAILQEARALLEGEGYAALSTRRIASAVGCTATSIYLHFKSKDSLIYALIDEGFEELNRRVVEVAGGDGNALSLLRDVARAYVDFGLERPEYYEIMFMLRAEQMERYPVDAYRRARRSLDVFAELTALPAEEAARRGAIVWSTLHGLVSLLIAQRIDISLDREALIEDSIHSACLGAFAALPSGANSA